MTAVTAAQKLLYDAAALENPYDNEFYNTWVKDISLDRLLALSQDERAAFSFFSSNAIEAIADDYIAGKFRPKRPYLRHPAVDGPLKLGLALSNLVGVDYAYPIARKKVQLDKNTFDYTSSRPQCSRLLGPGPCPCSSSLVSSPVWLDANDFAQR